MSEQEKSENRSTENVAGHVNASVFRILDASFNRAQEGIRVVEDYARMVLDDGFLSRSLKQLRHDLTAACQPIDLAGRLQSRESEIDVGRDVHTESEYQRADDTSLLRSNMSRVQQALRTIEEFSKSAFPSVVAGVEQLRYRSYTLEKAIFNTRFNVDRLQQAKLYVLLDAGGETGPEFPKLKSLVSALVEANVDLIQLRDKSLGDRELVAAGRVIGELTRDRSTRWIMNDRIDLAFAADADGVHLGQDDLSVHDARRILRSGKLVGLSTHSIDQAREAVLLGADYIGVGPVFPSQTKSFDEFPGIDLVRSVCGEIALPSFAIGGVAASKLDSLRAAGCQRVAVGSSICNANDPAAAAREVCAKLNE